MPVDKDIAEYLEDQGYGTVGTDIFIGWMPDTPTNAIVVTATQGRPPMVLGDLEMPGFQVRVRNSAYDSGWTVANNILDLLHALTDATIETRNYYRIDAQGSVTALGRDEKDRDLFSVNFIAIKAIE
jgi:hypothetical protein